MVDLRDTAPGVLAAISAGAALFAIARFVYLDSAAGPAFVVSAVAAVAALGAVFARRFRRPAEARDAGRVRSPIVAGSWLLAAAVAFGGLIWVLGPADRFGSVVHLFVAALIAGVCGVGIPSAGDGRWLAGVVALAVGALAAGYSGVVTDARWALARAEFDAIAAASPAVGPAQDRRVGTFAARVAARRDGSVTFRFGDSWQGLIFVPPNLPDPSPDDPLGYYQPWSDRWWTYQAY